METVDITNMPLRYGSDKGQQGHPRSDLYM